MKILMLAVALVLPASTRHQPGRRRMAASRLPTAASLDERPRNRAGRRGRVCHRRPAGNSFTDEGYRVVRAANGRQELQRLAEGSLPDLVISDFIMPVLDGAGLVQAMRQSEGQREVSIIIIISSMPEANVLARIDGYAAFVRKPFQIAALMRLIASVLGSAQPAS